MSILNFNQYFVLDKCNYNHDDIRKMILIKYIFYVSKLNIFETIGSQSLKF